MSEEKSEFEKQIEKTCADLKEFGFEFQFIYFVLKVLTMKEGESVSWEVEDDVSLRSSNGTLILFQLKHSFDSNPALRNLDVDLWKSLSNWSDLIIAAKNSGNAEFLQKTQFFLVSNKENRSKFLEKAEDFQNGKIDLSFVVFWHYTRFEYWDNIATILLAMHCDLVPYD